MFEKAGALLSVFRAGNAALGAARLQRYAMNAGLLAALLVALAQGAKALFGLTIPLDDATALNIASGALALWGVVDGLCHAASNPDVGLPGLKPDDRRDAAIERARLDVVEHATGAPGTARPEPGSMDARGADAGQSQPLPVAREDRADSAPEHHDAPVPAASNWIEWSRNGGG